MNIRYYAYVTLTLLIAIILGSITHPSITNQQKYNHLIEKNLFYKVNYTGLPEEVNVKVYPESHNISGNCLRIVIENNRDKELYWGSYWEAEKYIKGKWVLQDPGWGWPDYLAFTKPHSFTVGDERFPFSDGLYRITKPFMLNDKIDIVNDEWADEFTATFYIIKTQ